MNRLTTLTCAVLLGACTTTEPAVQTDGQNPATPDVTQDATTVDRAATGPQAVAVGEDTATEQPFAAPLAEPMEPAGSGPEADSAGPASEQQLLTARAEMLGAIRGDDLDGASATYATLQGRMEFDPTDPRTELAADLEALAGFVMAMQARED